jgi:hypothetical protein
VKHPDLGAWLLVALVVAVDLGLAWLAWIFGR